ncbi:hypothetical protein U91I_00206 [alpha proteobacterium U9-1i]|nr:hypothetical protein U91I_00206 [alpha proteobacterium U9-1i]
MMRRFFPANRLAQYVGVAEGVTVHDAVDGAQEQLGALREIVVGTIEVKVSMLQGLATQLTAPNGADLVPEIYALANDIFCDSGVFDFDDLSEGAFQLCDLIAHWRSGAPFNPDAIHVHIAAIALLADTRATLGPEERRAIIAGLKRVHSKFADRSETPANEND